MSEQPEPRKRRRAVGPAGGRPAGPEPRDLLGDDACDERRDQRDDERLLADVPPHHGPV